MGLDWLHHLHNITSIITACLLDVTADSYQAGAQSRCSAQHHLHPFTCNDTIAVVEHITLLLFLGVLTASILSWQDKQLHISCHTGVQQQEFLSRTICGQMDVFCCMALSILQVSCERGFCHLDHLANHRRALVSLCGVDMPLKRFLLPADVVQEAPIMVLDELDSGVGARLGGVMGRLLQRMAATSLSQLLCITHLPQVIYFRIGLATSNHNSQMHAQSHVHTIQCMLLGNS